MVLFLLIWKYGMLACLQMLDTLLQLLFLSKQTIGFSFKT